MNDDTTLAVVTGASRGIGAAVVDAARADGAVVATTSRGDLASDHHLRLALGRPDEWPLLGTWLAQVLAEVAPDRLVFVHNAATLTPIGFAGEVDSAAYAENVVVNSAAAQVVGDAVIRQARAADVSTVLVQISSGAGKTPFPGWSSYCAAKAAVDMWCRVAGAEQHERGDRVRILSVGPGVVDTEMQAEIRASADDAFPQVERFRSLHAAGNLADAATVGAGIWAVASTGDWANGTVSDLHQLL